MRITIKKHTHASLIHLTIFNITIKAILSLNEKRKKDMNTGVYMERKCTKLVMTDIRSLVVCLPTVGVYGNWKNDHFFITH